MDKQVDKSHYEFRRYMSKARWTSVWHQLDEVLRLQPRNVLEIGPGPGVFKAAARQFGIKVETLDLDSALNPDHVGSAAAMPFPDCSYDVVCAFQMLEHLPYEVALTAFQEMVRVSRTHIVISLPDAKHVWRYHVHIPKLGGYSFLLPRPRFASPRHIFDGEHYWELNKKGFELSRVVKDLSAMARLVTQYRVNENPYHRFFVFKCLS